MAAKNFGPGWARRAVKASNKRVAAKKAAKALAPTPVNPNASRQLSSTARWAIQNPDLAAYDNDGNPVDKSVWFD